MPQYWRLTGLDASNYVVVRQRDEQLLSKYPLAEPRTIESMMDYWLANPLERDILRSICAAVSKVAVATDAQVKKTLGDAFGKRQLLAADIPYAVTALEGVTLTLLKDVPRHLQGEALQALVAHRLSKGRLSLEDATTLVRSGKLSDLKDFENPGTDKLQVCLRDSQYALLTGADAAALAKPRLPLQIGFISHRDGGNIRNLPAEQPGSRCLTPKPLPPGTRLIVLGSGAPLPEWVHVAAVWEGHIVRGYIQGFRVTTDLPEPAATLYRVKPHDTLEPSRPASITRPSSRAATCASMKTSFSTSTRRQAGGESGGSTEMCSSSPESASGWSAPPSPTSSRASSPAAP